MAASTHVPVISMEEERKEGGEEEGGREGRRRKDLLLPALPAFHTGLAFFTFLPLPHHGFSQNHVLLCLYAFHLSLCCVTLWRWRLFSYCRRLYDHIRRHLRAADLPYYDLAKSHITACHTLYPSLAGLCLLHLTLLPYGLPANHHLAFSTSSHTTSPALLPVAFGVDGSRFNRLPTACPNASACCCLPSLYIHCRTLFMGISSRRRPCNRCFVSGRSFNIENSTILAYDGTVAPVPVR